MAFPTAVNSQITDSFTQINENEKNGEATQQSVDEGIDTASTGETEFENDAELNVDPVYQSVSTLGVTKLFSENEVDESASKAEGSAD